MGVNLKATLPGLLTERGMTQAELAEKTGITRTDINAFARGRTEAGRDRLARIADALEVSLVDLGAAEEEDDTPVRASILGRLEELAATVADVLENQEMGLRLLAEIREALDSGGEAGQGRPTRRRR